MARWQGQGGGSWLAPLDPAVQRGLADGLTSVQQGEAASVYGGRVDTEAKSRTACHRPECVRCREQLSEERMVSVALRREVHEAKRRVADLQRAIRFQFERALDAKRRAG